MSVSKQQSILREERLAGRLAVGSGERGKKSEREVVGTIGHNAACEVQQKKEEGRGER